MLNCIGRKAGKRGTGDIHTLLNSVGSLTCRRRDALRRSEVPCLERLDDDILRTLLTAREAISGPSPIHIEERLSTRRVSW